MEGTTNLNSQDPVSQRDSKGQIMNTEDSSEILTIFENSTSKSQVNCEDNTNLSPVSVPNKADETSEIISTDTSSTINVVDSDKTNSKDQQDSLEIVDASPVTTLEQSNDAVTREMKSCEEPVASNEVVILDDTKVHENGNDSKLEVKENNEKISSLGAIALEYDSSDSDIEDISDCHQKKDTQESSQMDVQILSYSIYRNEVSSSSENDSEDDSSSSDSSSSDSSAEIISDDSDSDDSTRKKNKSNNSTKNKKNEMKNEWDDLPPIEDLKITVPEVLCDPLGEVAWMVEQLVVVRPKAGKPTLNLDTVLFIERGKRTLGKIFDVFGQVNEPHYCVRFNSTEHIKESDIKVGMTVYYCPNTQYTSLVFLHELTKIKGTDGGGDDEPPEFSDDEEEQAYYEMLKQKQGSNTNDTDVPFKRKRTKSPSSGWQSNHPWNRSGRQKKDNQHTRRDRRQFTAPIQNGSSPYNGWPSVPYQSNWPPAPRHMHPAYPDPYVYDAYSNSLQAMQYTNPNESNPEQSFQDTQNNYSNDNSMVMCPRIPYNVRHRFSPSFGPFNHNRPNAPFLNMRFRYPDMSRQVPPRVNTPWVSLPPPPPPPPPSTGS